jgi:hypothetical protein
VNGCTSGRCAATSIVVVASVALAAVGAAAEQGAGASVSRANYPPADGQELWNPNVFG